jgi:hypothetical protein
MNRLLLFSLFFLLTISLLPADTGQWASDFRLSGGPLYTENENTEVSLEEELLVFSGEKSTTAATDAYFLFYNNSPSAVTVDVGFPVKTFLEINMTSVEGTPVSYSYSSGKYGGHNIDFLAIIFASDMKWDRDALSINIPAENIQRREKYSFEDFNGKFGQYFQIRVFQDKKPVTIPFVIMETRVAKKENRQYILEVFFHFQHSLVFPGAGFSKVDVHYSSLVHVAGSKQFGFKSSFMYYFNSFMWDYILYTGKTWKGPIKTLLFALPEGIDVQMPPGFSEKVIFPVLGSRMQVYAALQYEPGGTDEIHARYTDQEDLSEDGSKNIWFTQPSYLAKPDKCAQDFVTVKSGSSFLDEKADIYVNKGVIKDADFKPLSLFDGLRESAWVEGRPDEGKGEWVEFSISKDVRGLEIQNGFIRSLKHIEDKNIDTVYEKNNRVRKLEIISSDQNIKVGIDLADTKDLQVFPGIALPRGTYKLYIRDVYKGTKWNDTCLGEIYFFTDNAALQNIIDKSVFFKELLR